MFCRGSSTCRCISDVFVGRKVISMSYPSAILKVSSRPMSSCCQFLWSQQSAMPIGHSQSMFYQLHTYSFSLFWSLNYIIVKERERSNESLEEEINLTFSPHLCFFISSNSSYSLNRRRNSELGKILRKRRKLYSRKEYFEFWKRNFPTPSSIFFY